MAEKNDNIPNITIEDARFVYRTNFSGRGPDEGEKYNVDREKYFNVQISEDMVVPLRKDGWNIKFTKGTEDYPEVPYLVVKVGFAYRPPTIVVVRNGHQTHLNEQTVSSLDVMQLEKVDCVIRPYAWSSDFGSGIKAYLQTLYAFPVMDDIMAKYANLGEE